MAIFSSQAKMNSKALKRFLYAFHTHREMYTPLNPTFIEKNWGLQGFT